MIELRWYKGSLHLQPVLQYRILHEIMVYEQVAKQQWQEDWIDIPTVIEEWIRIS